ncbi:MAG: sulfatase-like hydrolase/transferase [Pirellulales bacterium]
MDASRLPRLVAGMCVVACAIAATPGIALADETPPRPNIVFILADDLGWTDLACYGSGYYETPHIDALRADGLKFTDAYTAAPNCAPTRACLMTGRYTPRHGIYTVGSGARQAQFRRMEPVENRTDLPLSEQTVADVLRGRLHDGYVWQVAPGDRR